MTGAYERTMSAGRRFAERYRTAFRVLAQGPGPSGARHDPEPWPMPWRAQDVRGFVTEGTELRMEAMREHARRLREWGARWPAGSETRRMVEAEAMAADARADALERDL